MTRVAAGTAHLFGLVPADESRGLLAAAWDAGFRRFDTAPSYGHGACESELTHVLATARAEAVVTTKVGIAPVLASRPRRIAGRVLRSLPPPIKAVVRRGRPAAHGRFGVDEVRESVDRSLDRLGTVDRLLLHEVAPHDITDDLLTILVQYRDDGRVAELGVATQNDLTVECVHRAPELFTAAHISVGPLSGHVDLPDSVTARVGHGMLGPGASHLMAVETELRRDRQLGRRWADTVSDTSWTGRSGLAAALMATSAQKCTEVILATSRAERLKPTRVLLENNVQPPAHCVAVLDEAVRRARATAV